MDSKNSSPAGKEKQAQKNKVQPVNGFLLGIVYFFLRLYFFLCGVRVRPVNNVGKPEQPSIILCNHGSFVDFVFAATLLRKFKPNFVVARLYFYDHRLRWLLKSVGCFPKSMFAVDIESTKNCLQVLKNGGILAMMPEARLSTAGRFEDIQEGTYSFIKKAGVPVYTVKFGGDYLADPKWGKGFRRGAVVDAQLDLLFTAEQVKNLSPEELKEGIDNRLYYDEFKWLAENPQIRYRNANLAEGLENILTVCPLCGKKHTLTTKKRDIFCENCGKLTTLDDRYGFAEGFLFQNLSQWYDWQKDLMARQIAENEDFALVSPVELRLPSNGKGLTRHAGTGVCRLSRQGLCYQGTKDGETVQLSYSMDHIYRLLFGAGENFELYNGTEILYFVPEEKRSAVDWYIASILLRDSTIPQQ